MSISPVKEFGLECWKAREALHLSRDAAVNKINGLAVKKESIADKKTLERTEKGVNFPKIGIVIAMAEVYGAPYLIEKRIEYERLDFARKTACSQQTVHVTKEINYHYYITKVKSNQIRRLK